MCMVSNVHDYGQNDWKDWRRKWDTQPYSTYPTIQPFPAGGGIGGTPTVADQLAGQLAALNLWLEEFKKLVAAAEKFDKATNQPHCEDPTKMAWVREVEVRLKALEAAVLEKQK